MSDPYLVEESSPFKLAPNLKKLVVVLSSVEHHDYLIAVVIVVLAETGFFIPPEDDREEWTISSLQIPRNWKTNGTYQIIFHHNIHRQISCKLIAIPTGDMIILNFCNGSPVCSVFQTLKYVNPHSSNISGRFWNLKEFSFRLKNELITPLKAELLLKFGLPSPSLCGLPEEIRFLIFKMLNSRDRRNLSTAFSRFFPVNFESRSHDLLLLRRKAYFIA